MLMSSSIVKSAQVGFFAVSELGLWSLGATSHRLELKGSAIVLSLCDSVSSLAPVETGLFSCCVTLSNAVGRLCWPRQPGNTSVLCC